jgi:hypothetical protein
MRITLINTHHHNYSGIQAIAGYTYYRQLLPASLFITAIIHRFFLESIILTIYSTLIIVSSY